MSTEALGTLQSLSNDLAAIVENAGSVVVAVNGRPRTPSSGVQWKKGVVVTTDHTLRQDEEITVTTREGKTFNATLAGRDPGTDLAVLRAPALDLPEPQLAAPGSAKLGNLVLAIGRGLSASLGVVSSASGAWRTWRGGLVDEFIRLDVSIYTGFSGGALADAGGLIAGINTSGLSRGGGITVPVSTVNRVMEQLLAKGRIARGYLGVGMQPVRLPESGGLMVLSLEPEGPAAKAGVLLGDILIGIEGDALNDTDDLQAALTPDRIGKPVELRLVRGGVVQTLKVVVGERP
jgi:S1-C subfamily serine protease